MINTLVVDGDNLFRIGYYGVKNFYTKGRHVGAIYHFLNTIKRHLQTHNYDKIVVFWDGSENSSFRKKIFLHYKDNRKSRNLSEEQQESYDYQRNRVKQYLEELFVRHAEFQLCETDDAAAYYCQNSPNENKVIFSSDKDLTQLIKDDVKVYSPLDGYMYGVGDKVELNKVYFPIDNVVLTKVFVGDKSDNIDGIHFLGEKTFVTLFPEVLERKVTTEEIMEMAESKFKEDKDNRVLGNLLTGKTKRGVFGEEFLTINKQIVDLSVPLLTDEAKSDIIDLVEQPMDPSGRGWQNLIKMMHEDGLFQFLPKRDDGWTEFFTPLLKLARNEKQKFSKLKNKRRRK
jgi:5'-3' exonuclease